MSQRTYGRLSNVALVAVLGCWLTFGGIQVNLAPACPPPVVVSASGAAEESPRHRDGGDAASDPLDPAAVRREEAAFTAFQKSFVQDPSFRVRCKAPPILADPSCPSPTFKTVAQQPPLVGPRVTGDTTEHMTLHMMESLLPRPRPTVMTSRNGTIAHHEMLRRFANTTYADRFHPTRVMEFNGAHALEVYDCPADVDFRRYHQVRAAMCEQHAEYKRRQQVAAGRGGTTPTTTALGMFPVVDEEYFEYVMTLTTAYDAQRRGASYTFLELGARYGTWIARAGASFRLLGGDLDQLHLFAVEGSCEWFRKMEEHLACNHLANRSDLVLAYAGPKEYNKVRLGTPTTYSSPRAISLLDVLPAYGFVDMIDFDIQGFEAQTVEEDGVMELMNTRVGFVHFGTHSASIEAQLLHTFQEHDWTVVYFFAGSHTKKLSGSHQCMTPFGPSRFNDGVLGVANRRFYPHLPETNVKQGGMVRRGRGKKSKGAKTCHWLPQAAVPLLRPLP